MCDAPVHLYIIDILHCALHKEQLALLHSTALGFEAVILQIDCTKLASCNLSDKFGQHFIAGFV
jgi:hypothetical protein